MFHIKREIQLFLWSIISSMVVKAFSQDTSRDQVDKFNDNIWFDPPEVLLLPEGSTVNISWFTTLTYITKVTYHVEDESVSTVIPFNEQYVSMKNVSDSDLYNISNISVIGDYTYLGSFETQANFIGFNKIYVKIYNESNELVGVGELKMTVSLSYQKLNDMFTLSLGGFALFLYLTMGATLDMDIIFQIIKKPIGPIIGLICQYVFMPLIGYGLGLLFFPDDPLMRLGLFLTGCTPGGGLSNMFTHLLGGSLDLSIMMTFVSTIAAFGVVPLWVFTMGPLILKDQADFVIPYKDITITMTAMVIPCGIGLLIRWFFPRVAKVLEWLLNPFTIFFLIFILSFGTYSYRYLFLIATWKIYLAGFALPVIGYCSGVLAAVVFKQNITDVIAIAIETGIQNNSVALFILKFTLESPIGELTAVAPAASFLMTPAPLIMAVLVKKGYEWQTKSKHLDIPKDIEGEVKQLDYVHNSGTYQRTINSSIGVDNPVLDLQDETV